MPHKDTVEFSEPQDMSLSDTEVTLLPIWQDLLPRARIVPEAEFFELGGDSLTFMQMLNEVESRTGIRVDLEKVFEKCTLRHVAQLVDQDRQAG
jgi:phthiocerol/phenolphthiocerol synthesis type-I polyketide synthase E